MVKYLFLLAICAPLGWATFLEVRRLLDLSARPVTADDLPTAPDGEAVRQSLEAARANAEAVVNLPESVVAAAVGEADAPDPAEAPEPRTLSAPILARARALADARRQVEEVRRGAADVEQQIEDLRQRLADDDGPPGDRTDLLAKLEERVKEYESLEIHRPDLVRAARAQIAWVELQREHPRGELDRLYDRLDHWTPGTAPEDLGSPGAIQAHITALLAYLDQYEGTKVPQVARAQAQLALWEQGARLLAALKRGGSADRLDQLRTLAALVQEVPAPARERFERTARALARALCADYLKKENLDPIVLVQSDTDEPERVPRRDVRVRWKNGKIRSLADSGYDEYTLPRAEVEHLFVGEGRTRELPGDPGIPPLKGTPYSDAVHAYNVRRDQLKDWSEGELSKLRFACTPYQEALARGGPDPGGPRLLERIDALLALVRRYPRLFDAP